MQGAHNTLGGTEAGEGNVIAGNLIGLKLDGTLAHDNWVLGNRIGTDAAGTVAVGNANQGILIDGGAYNNTVGSNRDGVADAAEGNLVTATGDVGIQIWGAQTQGNTVSGNRIGTDATGDAVLGVIGTVGPPGSAVAPTTTPSAAPRPRPATPSWAAPTRPFNSPAPPTTTRSRATGSAPTRPARWRPAAARTASSCPTARWTTSSAAQQPVPATPFAIQPRTASVSKAPPPRATPCSATACSTTAARGISLDGVLPANDALDADGGANEPAEPPTDRQRHHHRQ